MPDNAITPPDEPPVRISGTPTADTDHPALRKIARAVISIAERQLAEEPTPDRAPQEKGDD